MKRFWASVWAFIVLAVTFPLFGIVTADGQLLPYAGLVLILVMSLGKLPGVAGFAAVHMAVYLLPMLFAAWCLGRLKLVWLAIAMACLLFVGSLPILSGGSDAYRDLNAYQFYPMTYETLSRWRRRPNF